MTMGSELAIDGAVVVTTPQRLSVVDVIKGLDMLAEMKIPAVSLVENLAYFDCDRGTRYFPFGEPAAERLIQQFGIPSLVHLPIAPSLAAEGAGVVPRPEFDRLAAEVLDVLAQLERGDDAPTVSFDPTAGLALRHGGALQLVEPRLARARSPLDPIPVSEVQQGIAVLSATPRGNFAVELRWSDGHTALYAYDFLKELTLMDS